LHIVEQVNHTERLQKLLVWAKKSQQNPNELKKKLLLAKDKYGFIAWHRAALFGRIHALEALRNQATELELNPHELLLAQHEQGLTALHMATQENHVGILQALWVWAEQAQQISNELKKKLLLAKDKNGCMAQHYAGFLAI